MSNDHKATGAGPGITADQARAISTLARTHKDQGAELTENQFREMANLQHQVGLAGYTVAGLPLSALALNEPNTVAYRLTDPAQSFQGDVATWMGQCFPPSLSSNMTERGDRLLEEVLELLQAHGYDSARVPTLVNYVFGRPVGEPAQEVGGVMVTLAAYCSVAGLSMQADGQAELDRINQPEVMARIRAKQETKNALHFDTPLPGSAAQPSPAGQGDAPWPEVDMILADAYSAGAEGLQFEGIARRAAVRAAVAALAARQPVSAAAIGGGQPVGDGWSGWATHYPGKMPKLYGAREIAEVNHCPEEGQRLILLSEQPAQAVDLGHFRYLAEWVKGGCNFLDCDPAKLDRACHDLLTIIDSQAVGNG